MRILQVSNFFKPSWETGGVTKVNYELSKHLAAKGHEVTVYTTDGYSSRLDVPKNRPVEVDGIKVYYFYNLFRVLVKKMKLPTPYYLPFVLRKEIQHFDIIHIHEHRTLSAAIVHYYAKKHGVPYVLHSHGSVLPFFQKNRLKKVFDYCFGYSILNNASRLIALTTTEADQYVQMDMQESKIEIIPNGINIDEFQDLPNEGEFRKKYSIDDDEKIILYLGRIDKIKGIDFLMDSFGVIAKEFTNIKLVIVGGASEYSLILKAKIKELGIDGKVLFTGTLHGLDKLKAYVDADVLVYPSKYEIFGLVPFEGIMCNTQTIITEECGCSEIFKEANCGYIVKYGDINSLTNEIKDCIENPRANDDVVKSGQQYVINNLDYAKVTEKLERVYEDCIRNI